MFCDKVLDPTCAEGSTGAGNIKNRAMGHPNKTDRIELQYYDVNYEGAVTAFTGSDCKGTMGRFDASTDPKITEYFNFAEIAKRHLPDKDTISSVVIPQGYNLELYKEDNGF